MVTQRIETVGDAMSTSSRISWGAVFAGVVLALVVQFLINLAGLGLGASTIDPGTSDNPSAAAASMTAAIWWIASGIVASFAGAFLAGRLSGKFGAGTGGWHGVTTWAATTLVVLYLLGTAAGGLIGGALSTVGSALGGIGQATGGAASTAIQAAAPAAARIPNPLEQIEQRVRSASAGQDPAAARDAAVSAIRAALTGNEAQAQAARDRAAQALATAQNIPVDQARAQVQDYETQYRQAVASAKEAAVKAADVAAKAVTRGALFGALALLLGAVAAWFGGSLGVRTARA